MDKAIDHLRTAISIAIIKLATGVHPKSDLLVRVYSKEPTTQGMHATVDPGADQDSLTRDDIVLMPEDEDEEREATLQQALDNE